MILFSSGSEKKIGNCIDRWENCISFKQILKIINFIICLKDIKIYNLFLIKTTA